MSDVRAIEKFFFFEDGGCASVHIFSFFVRVEGAPGE